MADFGPTHPGEVLLVDFMRPQRLGPGALAHALGVGREVVIAILRRKRGISPDLELRLAEYFGTSPEFWATIQSTYDLEREKDRQRFYDAAEEAMEEYRRTGLHVTREEVERWLSTWGTDDELDPPEPHK